MPLVCTIAGPVGFVPAGTVIVPKVVRPVVVGAIVSVGSAVGAIVPLGSAVAAGLVIVDNLVVRPRVVVELVIVDNLVVRPCVRRVLMYQPAPSLFTLVAVIPAAIATDDDPVICNSDAQFEFNKGSEISAIILSSSFISLSSSSINAWNLPPVMKSPRVAARGARGGSTSRHHAVHPPSEFSPTPFSSSQALAGRGSLQYFDMWPDLPQLKHVLSFRGLIGFVHSDVRCSP